MIPTTRALLSCVLLLSARLEGIRCRSGHCAGNLCSFETLGAFQDSKTACMESGGSLLKFRPEDDTKALASAVSGLAKKYWVHNTFPAQAEKCSAVSVMKGRGVEALGEPCSSKLDGFLCHYDLGAPCGRFRAPAAGAEVTYRTSTGLEVADSEGLPLGMWAETRKAGNVRLDARYMCTDQGWQRAPWACEVMRGGCEKNCSSATGTCACPEGESIHANNISCTSDSCAKCAHGCQKEGDSYVCQCPKGYRLEEDGKNCVDVNECLEGDPCTAENEECKNTVGGFECRCLYGFEEEDGECVDVSICLDCEHMDCRKVGGVYQCFCRKGFQVSPRDRTRCEQECTGRDCPASCPHSIHQCFCPDGYVTDTRDNATICTDINECEIQQMCAHTCENTFGSYRCSCNEGFRLEGTHECVKEEDDWDGSGSSTVFNSPASVPPTVQPATLPSYIKTGSVLGISVFMALCVVLLYFLVRSMTRRCKTIHHYTFKPPDIDIFYLQQVTTDTYKRFSFDKQIRNDSQKL